jgi:hypothetical protein
MKFVSDKANFQLSEFVKETEIHLWTDENPHQQHQKPLEFQSYIVVCGRIADLHLPHHDGT